MDAPLLPSSLCPIDIYVTSCCPPPQGLTSLCGWPSGWPARVTLGLFSISLCSWKGHRGGQAPGWDERGSTQGGTPKTSQIPSTVEVSKLLAHLHLTGGKNCQCPFWPGITKRPSYFKPIRCQASERKEGERKTSFQRYDGEMRPKQMGRKGSRRKCH